MVARRPWKTGEIVELRSKLAGVAVSDLRGALLALRDLAGTLDRPAETLFAKALSLVEREETPIDPQSLTREQRRIYEQGLWRRYRQRPNIENRNKLVELYLPLAKSVTYNMRPLTTRHQQASVDEFVQIAVVGLMQAIPRYDPASGAKPGTFLGHRVRGAILDFVRTLDWVPRIERQRLKRDAEALEIKMQATDFSEKPARRVSLAEMLADGRSVDPAAELEREDFWRRAARGLDPQERTLLRLAFREGCRQADIARALGISQGRVCVLIKRLLKKLRQRYEVAENLQEVAR